MESLEVDVDVNEAFIGQVKPDMPCEAVLDAYPDWKVPSHVIAIVPSADRGKATIKVRVALEQKADDMVPDMGVRVSFLGYPADGRTGAGTEGRARADAGGGAARWPTPRLRRDRRKGPAARGQAGRAGHGSMKLLPDGVKPGERVVLSPPASLRDGAEVRIEGQTP